MGCPHQAPGHKGEEGFTGSLSHPQQSKVVREGTGAGTHKAGLLVQTGLHKVLEQPAVGALQRRGVVLWDEEQDLHGVQVRVRWLPFGELNGRDAQGPDVSLKGHGAEDRKTPYTSAPPKDSARQVGQHHRVPPGSALPSVWVPIPSQ